MTIQITEMLTIRSGKAETTKQNKEAQAEMSMIFVTVTHRYPPHILSIRIGMFVIEFSYILIVPSSLANAAMSPDRSIRASLTG